jgi:hypothetical protein
VLAFNCQSCWVSHTDMHSITQAQAPLKCASLFWKYLTSVTTPLSQHQQAAGSSCWRHTQVLVSTSAGPVPSVSQLAFVQHFHCRPVMVSLSQNQTQDFLVRDGLLRDTVDTLSTEPKLWLNSRQGSHVVPARYHAAHRQRVALSCISTTDTNGSFSPAR